MATMVQSLSLRWRRRNNSCWPRATINRFNAAGSVDETFTLLLRPTICPPPQWTRTMVREERQGAQQRYLGPAEIPHARPTERSSRFGAVVRDRTSDLVTSGSDNRRPPTRLLTRRGASRTTSAGQPRGT
jgi:hypothetical protein